MIKHVSDKIQNAIQMELFKAKESIKIAVAWFTNELLLQPLILKLQNGVSVELIINDDEINRGGESSLDFTEYLEAGGILRWNDSKQLMHEKFCIIDNHIVITGSYNWTNKAEYNSEVETFYYDEEDSTQFFNDIFKKLSERYEKEVISNNHPTEDSDSMKWFEIDGYKVMLSVQKPYYDKDGFYYDEFGAKYSHDKRILIKGVDSEAFIQLMPMSVKEIGDFAFQGCTKLYNIKFRFGLDSIGYNAFDACSSLFRVIIPNPVTTIKPYAFSGCSSLVEIYIPDSVTSIGKGAFHSCSSLERIKMPIGIKKLDNNMFVGCSSLREIYLPDSLNEIGEYVFSGCSSIKYFHMPDSIVKIGKGAFVNCRKLNKIKFPDSITYIGEEAFEKCCSLESIEFPKIKVIKRETFECCSSLKHFYIPNGIVEIEDRAFNGCTSLLAIAVPPSLKKISLNAFDGCISLISLYVLEGNEKYDSRDRCNAIIEKSTNTLVIGCRRSKIPDDVTDIYRYSFEGREPQTIHVPASVLNGIEALSNCKTVYIPKDGYLSWYVKCMINYGRKPNTWEPPQYIEY